MDEWMNRIEAKLDALSNPNKDAEQIKRLLVAFKANRRIEAIKEVRAMTGLALKEAKDLVEDCNI